MTLGYVDGDALPFRQAHDAGTLERRGVHEDILSALIRSDKAEALIGILPLHRAQFFDGAAVAGHRPRHGNASPGRYACVAVLRRVTVHTMSGRRTSGSRFQCR